MGMCKKETRGWTSGPLLSAASMSFKAYFGLGARKRVFSSTSTESSDCASFINLMFSRRNISRRYSYSLRAGQKSAYLCTETTVYRYVDNLNTPKAWFAANIDSILELYGKEHRLQKEDVLLG